MLTSLSEDLKGAGPAIAIGLLTMLYGILFYVLSFLLHLNAPGNPDDHGFYHEKLALSRRVYVFVFYEPRTAYYV